MKLLVIRILGFFIGFFITLFIINYLNIEKKKIEKFELNVPSKETYINSKSTYISTSNVEVIPYINYKYMCINTYYDMHKISNSEGRWYESDLIKTKNISDTNEYQYFIFNKTIDFKPNRINSNGAYGANLNEIELRGPKCFYFANNIITNQLKEFSMILTMKINQINNDNNILFEMIGNTEVISRRHESPIDMPSKVNINIKKNEENNFDFDLTIGNLVYHGNIMNIDKDIILNSDFLTIGFIYSATDIKIYINRQLYRYTPEGSMNFTVKLGSMPIVINKLGSINMELYNFIYYKSVLPDEEYLNMFKYNYYYLSGINKAIETAAEKATHDAAEKCKKEEDIIEDNTLNKRLNELENKLGTCINKNIDDNDLDIKEIKPFNDIDLSDRIKNMSSNFFSFLF